MNAVSGHYKGETDDAPDFRLDVDGHYPLDVASGVLKAGDGLRLDWVAKVVRSGADRWTGEIRIRIGEISLMPQTNVEITVDQAKNPPEATVVFRGADALSKTRTYSRISES